MRAVALALGPRSRVSTTIEASRITHGATICALSVARIAPWGAAAKLGRRGARLGTEGRNHKGAEAASPRLPLMRPLSSIRVAIFALPQAQVGDQMNGQSNQLVERGQGVGKGEGPPRDGSDIDPYRCDS